MRSTATVFTRRSFVGTIVAAAGVAAVSCGRSAPEQQQQPQEAQQQILPSSAQPAAMTVYRDPSCGCCEAWAEIARNAGYKIKLIDHPDMAAIKRLYRVPQELFSCHTSVVGNYVVEGHVPIGAVRRLLYERPAGIKGIAVAGMPLGSPGMEVPGGAKEPFEIIAFDGDGAGTVFRG